MESTIVHLHKASDAEDGYALSLGDHRDAPWRAQRGYGSDFRKVWTVELQSERRPEFPLVDWNAVLERVIQAYDLSDPVLTDFPWPTQESTSSSPLGHGSGDG